MSKFSFVFILFIITNLIQTQENFSISGLNETEFIYRDISEKYEMNPNEQGNDYKSYFSNKLQLQMQYFNFLLGAKYNYYHPRYNQFLPIGSVGMEENEHYFDEYFIQFESDLFLGRLGTFESVIGSGIVLHNYLDEDFNIDSRLIGFYSQTNLEKWQLKFLYGLMENDDEDYQEENENDNVGAVDIRFDLTDFLRLGTSYLLQQTNQKLANAEHDYSQRDVIGGRFDLTTDLLEITSEYAESNEYFLHLLDDKKGHAIYSNATLYLDKFTINGAYKNYLNFNTKISDLPTVNHSEEPLHESYIPGTDEQGFMGEISFLPNFENEIVLNYAEGWSGDSKIKQSDLYSEIKHDFETSAITVEFSQLEQLDKNGNNWKKETTPVITFDFLLKELPIVIKGEYQYKKEDKAGDLESHYEPKLQTDISYLDYSLSLIAETQIGDSFDADDGEYWIGGEFAVYLYNCTDLRLFVGKEKAGKVCRNGVCKIQPEFSGVRLEVTTSF